MYVCVCECVGLCACECLYVCICECVCIMYVTVCVSV